MTGTSISWLCTLLVACGALELTAQVRERSPRFEFVKDNGRPKFLKEWKSIVIHLKDSLPAGPEVKRTHLVGGVLLYTTSDSITINFQDERWVEIIRDYNRDVYRRRESLNFQFDTVPIHRSYALSRVDHITYDHALTGSGVFITVVSAAGLLIYAPLRAMRFKDGTFDADRYLRVATPCLVGLGVGLVVMPFAEHRPRVKVKLGG
jgi:hypothetical protein